MRLEPCRFRDALVQYPHGNDFYQAYAHPLDAEAKVDASMSNVYQGSGIVLAVMLLTFGLRSGLLVSTLIPGVMIITVLMLGMLGESLNLMSLAALRIAHFALRTSRVREPSQYEACLLA